MEAGSVKVSYTEWKRKAISILLPPANRGSLHWEGGLADPPSDTMGYGKCAGGMHPVGMHSCFILH